MSIRDELPPRTGPWASRFDTEEAMVQADDALREAALKNHDLSPILPFEAVYGEGEKCLGKATAITIDPRRPYSPSGEVNYVYADFSTRGLLYGVYRPAQELENEDGPENDADLRNTTLYPYPGGYEEMDPVTAPLADLGLDVPGIDRRFLHFCAGILGVEAVDDLGMLRGTFDAAWPDYQDTIRAGLMHLVTNEPLTVEQWFGLTYVRFPDQRELRAYLAQVYAYLFEDFEAMPLAPQ
ncbi:hypothetical protein HXP44_23650 [Streptomyces sioyaensis]|uniref:Uncharacterized protein n=2 Tax=Streptomyces sioyaensis TaxID=67364 RepID=A0A4Q1R3F6_9ACTN|nr:hypothetical protein [Streptomyces sioyaensis]MBM4794978.1 hypothetical protein [Streptomyces sioyaensis]RXS67008.1 hypothetical protein EST54_13435 [Streptomyces sioyaensis]